MKELIKAELAVIRNELQDNYPDASNLKVHVLHFGFEPRTIISVYVTFLTRQTKSGLLQLAESKWHTIEKVATPKLGRAKLSDLATTTGSIIKYYQVNNYYCDELTIAAHSSNN